MYFVRLDHSSPANKAQIFVRDKEHVQINVLIILHY